MSVARPAFLVILLLCLAGPSEARDLLWQTNSGGDDIYIIAPSSGEQVKRLVVGANPHGIAATADGSTVFVSVEKNGEPNGELVWIDAQTQEIVTRLQVGLEPHQLAVTPDGRWVYVPCRDGHYWIIDAKQRRVVDKIHTGGRPHNTTASTDGRYMFLSPMGGRGEVTIVDVDAGHEVIGTIPFADSVRPPALSRDGTRLFQHVDGINGFQVADVASRRVTATVSHSSSLGWFLIIPEWIGWVSSEGLKRCHGLAIRPDQKEIWSTCGDYLAVHDIEDETYAEVALVDLPSKAYWLTFSPDSRLGFLALHDADQVAVVDAQSKELIRLIDAGNGPKRNLVLSTRVD